jgi:hypothetical protein
MALNKFFRFPFARSGDKVVVPDAVDPGGLVSYDQGYGPNYELAKTNPNALDIERTKMNELFFDMTTALQEYQSNGTPDWISNAQNGGVAFPYPLSARVRYTDGLIYQSMKAANTSLPTVAGDWQEETGRLARTLVYTRIAGVQNVSVNGAAFTTVGAGLYTRGLGVKYAIAEAQGAGGAGGGAFGTGASAGNVSMGAPGASGSYGKSLFLAATLGTSQAITVGAKGAGVAGGTGLSGGASSVGSLLTAPGGIGGTQFANQVPPSYNGNGAVVSAPTGANLVSVQGLSPFASIGLAAANGISGAGGSSQFGQGAPGPAFNTVGSNAVNPGSGGSGTVLNNAGGSATGGAGGDGLVIISEYM